MKTSLVIDDYIYREARKKALQEKKTLSEILSLWARAGMEALKQKKRNIKASSLKRVNLGKLLIDINSRNEWMDLLNDRD